MPISMIQASKMVKDALKKYSTDDKKLHFMLFQILTKVAKDHGPEAANSLIILNNLNYLTKGNMKYFK